MSNDVENSGKNALLIFGYSKDQMVSKAIFYGFACLLFLVFTRFFFFKNELYVTIFDVLLATAYGHFTLVSKNIKKALSEIKIVHTSIEKAKEYLDKENFLKVKEMGEVLSEKYKNNRDDRLTNVFKKIKDNAENENSFRLNQLFDEANNITSPFIKHVSELQNK